MRRFKPIPDLRCVFGDLTKKQLVVVLPKRIKLLAGWEISASELNHLTRGQLKWIYLCLLRRRSLSVRRVFEEIRLAKEGAGQGKGRAMAIRSTVGSG